jgi:hypothetical protein
MKNFCCLVFVFFVLACLPAAAQHRFAAVINPLPAAGFFFDGGGIGASFEASLFQTRGVLPGNGTLKAYFSMMKLDFVKVNNSDTLSRQDANLYTFGLKGRYVFFSDDLSGFFAGVHIRYVKSSMEVTFRSVYPPPQTAKFNELLLGPELGYKFIMPLGASSLGLYIEILAGYNFTIKKGGDYDAYKSHVPSAYRDMTGWIAGKGPCASFSFGLAL